MVAEEIIYCDTRAVRRQKLLMSLRSARIQCTLEVNSIMQITIGAKRGLNEARSTFRLKNSLGEGNFRVPGRNCMDIVPM